MEKGFIEYSRAEFADMASTLKTLRSQFILSLNAAPGVYETFKEFEIEEVDCTYSIAGKGRSKTVREVIITRGGT